MKQEFIDLGLPSGTLWAKHNVQIGSKKRFTHDEAVKIAKDMHLSLPTDDNFYEIIDKCKWKWITLFGKVKGYKITGPNGKSIFLTATGFYNGTSLLDEGSLGYYWSNGYYYYSSSAFLLFFYSRGKNMTAYSKYFSLSIRLIKR